MGSKSLKNSYHEQKLGGESILQNIQNDNHNLTDKICSSLFYSMQYRGLLIAGYVNWKFLLLYMLLLQNKRMEILFIPILFILKKNILEIRNFVYILLNNFIYNL